MITNSKILITGGCGFIGGHLAKILSEKSLKNNIILFDLNTGARTTASDLGLDKKDNVAIIQGSILDMDDFSRISSNLDYIIHAAGFLGINKVAEDQLSTMDVNVLGTRNCLEFARKLKTNPKCIVFSTSEIYGIDAMTPSEDDDSVIANKGRRWCYAASKVTVEYYLKAFVQKYGIHGSIVRPFNVFGPYRYGGNAMTTLVNNAISNQEILISGNGKQIRSWCSIDDFCEGVIAILERGKGDGDAYNIGDPNNQIDMYNLARLIVDLTGSKSRINVTHSEIEDVMLRVPNIDKATELLGYMPKKSFKDSILEVVSWIKSS